MTLIVALLTPGFVLLASDRRVTTTAVDPSVPGGRRVLTREDTDTKTILLDHRYVMGFAGLARIRSSDIDPVTSQAARRRVEIWLADALADVDPARYFDVMAEKFGAVCEEQRYSDAHEFLAAGWPEGTFGSGPPEVVRVDNRTAPHTFYCYRKRLDEKPYLLEFAGWPPPADSRSKLEALIERNLKRYAHQPKAFANAIQKFYRSVAPTSHGLVGAASLITTLPKAAVPVMSVNIDLDEPTETLYEQQEVSRFYPEPGSGLMHDSFSPAFICREFSAVGSVSGTTWWIGPTEGYA